ncbi:MAG: DUF4276 family protein [Magnetococcus sp. XQGC-1]
MRTIFCHVEEPSMEATLESLLPRLINGRAERKIINHGSKSQLLKNMPERLQGYRNMARSMDLGILVLVDRDIGDCVELKKTLERMAEKIGLSTKSNPAPDGLFLVVNRVVVEELEAWFLGDVAAIRAAYPRIPESLAKKQGFRDPDGIKGGTWEALHREMKKAGYCNDRFPKLGVARNIAPHMDTEVNNSASFRIFRRGLEALLSQPTTKK